MCFAVSMAVCAGGDTLRVRQRQSREVKPQVSYGVKGGFNSSMFIIDEFKVNGTSIKEMQNNYKVGFNLALFTRINWGRHLLQLSPEFSVINSEITFDKKASQHPDVVPDYATISTNLKTFNLHAVYGYSVIDEASYGLAVFGGPVIKYIWRDKSHISYINFSDTMVETIKPVCVNFEVGVSVKISYLFFDISYEVGLTNVSKAIVEQNGASSETVLDRRNNVLSFSFGCSF